MRAIPILVAAALLAAAGCAPRDREVRLARAEAETRNLEALFDRLEDRLLVNQARVRFWREMRDRHESVAAIACASLEEHAVAMERRSAPRPSLRVASAAGEVASARAPATP